MRLTPEAQQIATLTAGLERLARILDRWDHGEQCGRNSECEECGDDGCSYHGDEICPQCECGMNQTRDLIDETLESSKRINRDAINRDAIGREKEPRYFNHIQQEATAGRPETDTNRPTAAAGEE